MKVLSKSLALALALATPFGASPTQAAVAPIQESFGNIGPTLSYQSLEAFRSADPAPWYTSFNLMTRSNVTLGVLGLTGGAFGTAFDLTSIRIVTLDGANVAFGTDNFGSNPFPDPIDALVSVQSLAAGAYALEVSGSGDRVCAGALCDVTDFAMRLKVTAAPGSGPVADVAVLPPQAAYGNVFPILSEQRLEVLRNGNAAPTYVSFNLLAQADVTLGVTGLVGGAFGSLYNVHAIRLVDAAGHHVAFGSDTFVGDPFSLASEQLLRVGALTPGAYLLEVSGSGDRVCAGALCDVSDFAVNLRVASPIPEPATMLLWLGGLAGFGWSMRRRRY